MPYYCYVSIERGNFEEATRRLRASYWNAVRELDVFRLRQWESRRLTLPQLRILFSVARHPGVTANELAGDMGVTVSTMSGLVAKLVERGWVIKGVSRDDRRQLPLELTEEGRRITEQVAEEGDRLFEEIAALLGSDVERVTEALERVADAAARARAGIDRADERT